MKIIEYKTPTDITLKSKLLNKYFDIIETEISISFRVFKNKKTSELHIYKKHTNDNNGGIYQGG